MNLSRNYTCPCLCSLEKERSQFTTSQQHIQAQEPKERSNKWDRAWKRETERLEREERPRDYVGVWKLHGTWPCRCKVYFDPFVTSI